MKVEEGKDEHDVRKQGEVLQEYEDGLVDELNRLLKAWEELKDFLVRVTRPALACATEHGALLLTARALRGSRSTCPAARAARRPAAPRAPRTCACSGTNA